MKAKFRLDARTELGVVSIPSISSGGNLVNFLHITYAPIVAMNMTISGESHLVPTIALKPSNRIKPICLNRVSKKSQF